MKIKITRQAVCLADDWMEPLELPLELPAEATLKALANEVAGSRFLHFSSTHHTLTGRVGEKPLLEIRSRWGSLSVGYLLAADTRLSALVAAGAEVRFSFE